MSSPTLKDLRTGSILSGRLSEPQVKAMTHLPFGLFDGVKQVEIEYDVNMAPIGASEHPGSYVRFAITFGKNFSVQKEALEALTKSVKTLTFQNVEVLILNKKTGKAVVPNV